MTTSQEPTVRGRGELRGDAFRDVKVAYLSETDLFQDLRERDLDEIERSTAMSSCTRGRVFFTPGESGEVLFILKSGRVNLYRMTAEGEKLVIATIEPGTVFGEMSLIGQGMFDSFAEAADDCTLCVMSRVDVERLLREHPPVSVRLLELLARRLRETQERLADAAYKSQCRRGLRRRCCGCRARARSRCGCRTRTSPRWWARIVRRRRGSSTSCAPRA